MIPRPDPTERAARILAERGPADRLEAFMMLAGQDYLWRMQGPDALAELARRDPSALPGIGIEPCAGGWRLVRRPYADSLLPVRGK